MKYNKNNNEHILFLFCQVMNREAYLDQQTPHICATETGSIFAIPAQGRLDWERSNKSRKNNFSDQVVVLKTKAKSLSARCITNT